MTLVGDLATPPVLSAPADTPAIDGTWKLLVLPYRDDEFLIFEIKA